MLVPLEWSVQLLDDQLDLVVPLRLLQVLPVPVLQHLLKKPHT